MPIDFLRSIVLGGALLSLVAPASGAIVTTPLIASSTTLGNWYPILLPGTTTATYGTGDFFDDQQTGAQFNNASDIVGDTLGMNAGSNPGAYIAFFGDAGENPNGMLAFRVRLGTQHGQNGYFKDVIHFGIDGNGNGTLDVYVSYINNTGNALVGKINIYSVAMANQPVSGSVVGDSPNNSTPSGTNAYTIAAVENQTFAYKAVNTNVNTAGTNHAGATDVDADGGVDYFLSYAISWSTLATQMQSLAGVTIDPNNLRFFVAAARQDNQINQDIYGLKGDFTTAQKTLTWTQLGLITNRYQLNEIDSPEPATIGLCAATLFGLWIWRRQGSRTR